MINNYVKVVRYDGARIAWQDMFPFNDRDMSATAVAIAGALNVAGFGGGVVSVFRHVPDANLPEIGRGGGFA